MFFKPAINHIGAFGIIYFKDDPSQLFFEIKDDSHPVERVRRKICCIGGNWIDAVAQNDASPLATFRRELQEELSFNRPLHTSAELVMLGLIADQPFHAVPKPAIHVDAKDRQALAQLKEAMINSAVNFGDFINTASFNILGVQDNDPVNDDFIWLSSYYSIGLEAKAWQRLVLLQQKFNNLSNESITMIISLENILKTGLKTAFGHDHALREFFLSQGFKEAENLPLIEGLKTQKVGAPLATYKEYLEKYEIAKQPQ